MTRAAPRHVLELPASSAAPRLARQFVGRVLDEWQFEELAEMTALLASEVVTNAVVHAGTTSRLCIERFPGGIRVVVEDLGDGVAARSAPRPGIAGGHGLALVDTLAADWGARRVDGHHEVWFELRRSAAE